jgi:hypothetical protein
MFRRLELRCNGVSGELAPISAPDSANEPGRTAILGMLTVALDMGPGAQMQQPLAIRVIGGLTANMLFTRVVISVGYPVLERRTARA